MKPTVAKVGSVAVIQMDFFNDYLPRLLKLSMLYQLRGQLVEITHLLENGQRTATFVLLKNRKVEIERDLAELEKQLGSFEFTAKEREVIALSAEVQKKEASPAQD